VAVKIASPDWAERTDAALISLKKNEKECEAIKQEEYRNHAKESYALARRKYESEKRLYQEALDNGYVTVDTVVNLPFREAAGLRLSKFLNALKDEKKILALRCPQCQRVIFPPRPVCGFCRITVGQSEEHWFSLKDTGTTTSIVLATEREVDRATARIVGEPNPCAFIRLDGGDEWTVLVHYLEMIDFHKLRRGLRVKAVWKPKEERRGRMSDIAYFKIIEGEA
jgi:uncharacterized OB-fold protein